jgi:hypothetical protein
MPSSDQVTHITGGTGPVGGGGSIYVGDPPAPRPIPMAAALSGNVTIPLEVYTELIRENERLKAGVLERSMPEQDYEWNFIIRDLLALTAGVDMDSSLRERLKAIGTRLVQWREKKL